MSILVGTNAYAYVNYKLTGESQQDLVLTLQPKSESSVNLGIRFDSEEIIGVLVNATYHKGKRNHSRFAFTGRVGSKISSAMLDYSIERSPLRNFNCRISSAIIIWTFMKREIKVQHYLYAPSCRICLFGYELVELQSEGWTAL